MLYHVNERYIYFQTKIRKVAPHEFVRCATADIVSGEPKYARPRYENIVRYEMRTAADATYRELTPASVSRDVTAWRDVSLRGNPPTAGNPTRTPYAPSFAIEGEKLILTPTPAENVTAGLRVVIAYPHRLVATTDSPRIPEDLHDFLAFAAAIRAVEESKDAAAPIVDRWRARVDAIFGDSPQAVQALADRYAQLQNVPIYGRHIG